MESYNDEGVSRVLEKLLSVKEDVAPSVKTIIEDLGRLLGVDPGGKSHRKRRSYLVLVMGSHLDGQPSSIIWILSKAPALQHIQGKRLIRRCG